MSLNLDKSNWTQVVFGDAIVSVTERVKPSEAEVERYVGLEHIDSGTLTLERWDSPDTVQSQKLRFQPGDVIFGRRRAYQKKVARADFEGICSAHALVLRAKPECIDPDFLPIFLSSDYFLDRAIEISVGSLSPTVNWRDLKIQTFSLPPLDEQQRLASLMWALERHSGQLQNTITSLEQSFDSIVADTLNTCSSDHARIGSLVRKGTSVTYGIVQAGPDIETGVPYIRVSDMSSGQLGVTGMKRTSHEIASKFKRSRVEVGDLVVALRGRTGLTLSVPEELNGANLTQGTARVAVDSEKVDPNYVKIVMNSAWMKRHIDRRAKGSTFTELSLAALRSLPIPRFTNEIEKALIRDVESLHCATRRVNEEFNALIHLRNSLLEEIFGDN